MCNLSKDIESEAFHKFRQVLVLQGEAVVLSTYGLYELSRKTGLREHSRSGFTSNSGPPWHSLYLFPRCKNTALAPFLRVTFICKVVKTYEQCGYVREICWLAPCGSSVRQSDECRVPSAVLYGLLFFGNWIAIISLIFTCCCQL